jgi:hypothetical protein
MYLSKKYEIVKTENENKFPDIPEEIEYNEDNDFVVFYVSENKNRNPRRRKLHKHKIFQNMGKEIKPRRKKEIIDNEVDGDARVPKLNVYVKNTVPQIPQIPQSITKFHNDYNAGYLLSSSS